MRTRSNAPGVFTPDPVYSPRKTLLAGAAVVVAVLVALTAAAYPFVALAAVALAAMGRPVVRRAAQVFEARRRQGRARRYSLPATNVSFEL